GGGDGRAVVECARGGDRGGDGDRDVGARGQAGDGAWQGRAAAASDVGDRQIRRGVGDLYRGRGRRTGVGDEERVADRLADRERTGGGQCLDDRDVGGDAGDAAVAGVVGVVRWVWIGLRRRCRGAVV